MSDFNINWAKENIKKENIILFDIGCADMHATFEFKKVFPNGIFYAFECKNEWKSLNEIKAKEYNIHYHHLAISDSNEKIKFYPSKTYKNKIWHYSSSIYKPTNWLIENSKIEFDEPYFVDSITFETFCKNNNIIPDIVHIDVQGAEYAVLSKMGIFKPKIIWAEICEFHSYETNTDYLKFNKLMKDCGYIEVYNNNSDALFILNNIKYTNY
jgi:FkbM family methyltransferase